MGVPLMARTDPRPHYGTKRRVRDGYVDVFEPAHPIARADGYVAEHRKVMHDLGLLTDPRQHVHHRNGDKADNRPENLEVVTAQEHPHRHELGGWAGENAAKTHCSQGHALVDGNLYRSSTGGRACRRCALDRAREQKACSRKLGLR